MDANEIHKVFKGSFLLRKGGIKLINEKGQDI